MVYFIELLCVDVVCFVNEGVFVVELECVGFWIEFD